MQFSRSELLWGENSTEIMKNSTVAVFGLGGVGGYTVEALARMGVGNLHIIDSDTVSVSNINRQIIALHSTVGRKKTEVFKERILDINPGCNVTVHDVFYLPQTGGDFDFSAFDYVVDAIDTVSAKIDIIERCTKLGVPVISSMGTGNKLNPAELTVADIYQTSVCPLARVMRYELKKRNIDKLKVVYSAEKPRKTLTECENEGKKPIPGSNPFVPPVAGLIIASEVVKDLLENKGYE